MRNPSEEPHPNGSAELMHSAAPLNLGLGRSAPDPAREPTPEWRCQDGRMAEVQTAHTAWLSPEELWAIRVLLDEAFSVHSAARVGLTAPLSVDVPIGDPAAGRCGPRHSPRENMVDMVAAR